MFRSTTIFRGYNVLAKVTIILTTFGCMLSVVMWQHVVLFVSGCT